MGGTGRMMSMRVYCGGRTVPKHFGELVCDWFEGVNEESSADVAIDGMDGSVDSGVEPCEMGGVAALHLRNRPLESCGEAAAVCDCLLVSVLSAVGSASVEAIGGCQWLWRLWLESCSRHQDGVGETLSPVQSCVLLLSLFLQATARWHCS